MQNIISILSRYLSHINMPSVNIIDVIEILLISVFVYQFMVWIKYTRAYNLLKGLLIIVTFLLIAYIFKMNTILWIVSKLATALITAVIVIFQPELRKIVEQLGQKRIMAAIIPFDVGKEVQERFTDKTINELVKACLDMSEAKTGALIVIEQKNLLDEFIRTGINVDAVLSSQLLTNIFEHNTPKLGKTIEEKTDKKGNKYRTFSGVSSEKVSDGFEYIWISFFDFSQVLDDAIKPETKVEIAGTLDLSFFKEKLTISSRIKSVSPYVPVANTSNQE